MKNYSPKEKERSEKKGCLVRWKMNGEGKGRTAAVEVRDKC